MAQVIHTVNVVYGSYSQDGIKITCDENDDLDQIKAKIKRLYSLNFLAMYTYSVKIVNTEKIPEPRY